MEIATERDGNRTQRDFQSILMAHLAKMQDAIRRSEEVLGEIREEKQWKSTR